MMGCSASAYSNDEDKYVARCKQLGVTPVSDLNPYGVHASWIKARLEGNPISFAAFETLDEIRHQLPKIRLMLGTLNYIEGRLDTLQSDLKTQLSAPSGPTITIRGTHKIIDPFEDVKEDAYTREHLIAICEAAVVPVDKWTNRDTPAAQEQVGKCWVLLKAGCKFRIHTRIHNSLKTTDTVIWFTMNWANFAAIEEGLDDGGAYGNQQAFYLPTPKELREKRGKDWY